MKSFEKAVIAEANKRAKEKLEEARKEAEGSLRQREEFWKAELEKALQDAEKQAIEEEKERMAWAKLEAKRIKSRATDDLVEKAIESIIEEFRKRLSEKEGEELIRKTAEDARKTLGEVVVRVPKHSRAEISGFRVEHDLDIAAGFVVESKDGKVAYNFTVEELVELYRDDIRKIILESELKGYIIHTAKKPVQAPQMQKAAQRPPLAREKQEKKQKKYGKPKKYPRPEKPAAKKRYAKK